MLPIEHYLFLSLALFIIGVIGVVTRRNVIVVLMSIELILNAVNINLAAFSRLYGDVAGGGCLLLFFCCAAVGGGGGAGSVIPFFLDPGARGGGSTVYFGEVPGARRREQEQ